jgi:hypothetical protein
VYRLILLLLLLLLLLSPVNYLARVQEHEGADNLGGVEAGALLTEASRLLDLEQQVSSIDILHDKEELILNE